MKSRFVLIVMALFLLASVSPARSQTQITLHMMSYDTTNQENRNTPWFDKILKDFEAKHPGLTIEVNALPFPQYNPALETMIAGNQLPDVFYGITKAAQLGRAGLVINYKDYVDAKWLSRFAAGPLRQTTFGDAIYGVPNNAQLFVFFVNPKIMKELGLKDPVTWDDLVAMAPTITKAGYIPLAWGNSASNVCPDFFLPLIAQYGGDAFALDDLSDPKVSWDSKPVIDALTLLDRLAKAGVFVPGINGVSETQGDQIWYQGKAAMKYGGSWTPGNIDKDAPEELAKSYYVIKVPALTPDAVHWTGDGSGESWVIKAKSPNTDLSVELVKYLLSDEVYSVYVKQTQTLPSMGWASKYVDNPFVAKMAEWLPTDGADHILFGQGSWDAVSNVCAGILDGSVTPKDGAAKIQAAVLASRKH